MPIHYLLSCDSHSSPFVPVVHKHNIWYRLKATQFLWFSLSLSLLASIYMFPVHFNIFTFWYGNNNSSNRISWKKKYEVLSREKWYAREQSKTVNNIKSAKIVVSLKLHVKRMKMACACVNGRDWPVERERERVAVLRATEINAAYVTQTKTLKPLPIGKSKKKTNCVCIRVSECAWNGIGAFCTIRTGILGNHNRTRPPSSNCTSNNETETKSIPFSISFRFLAVQISVAEGFERDAHIVNLCTIVLNH